MLSSRRLLRPVAVTAAVFALAFSAACSSDDSTDLPEAADASASVDPDEAAVAEAATAYWDAYIESQNGPNSDPELFEGIAEGGIVESKLHTAQQYEDMGFRRVGQPKISEPEVTVKGDSAVAVQCVDDSDWGGKQNGKSIPPPEGGPRVSSLKLEKRADDWLVVGYAKTGKADAC